MSRFIFILVILQMMGAMGKAVDEPENAAALKAVANDGLEFSKKFYQTSAKLVPGNLISSPVSVLSAVSMLAYGARGPTETALKSGLHFNKDEAVQQKGLTNLIQELNSSAGVELRLANKIFVAKSVTIKPNYKQLVKEIFKSDTERVDFTKADEASRAINDWCEKQTNSKITDVVSPGDLRGDTLSVLVNAVYFKGKWETPFPKEATRDEKFHLYDGSTKNVSSMHIWRRYNYGVLEDVKAKFAELPYQGGEVSMFIVLPDEVTGLRNIQQNFAELNLNRLLTESSKVHLSLSLPIFEIKTKIDLKQPLIDLGMGSIFGEGADLSGMFDISAKIGKAVQKAYIKVDEEGTEAAAVTHLEVMPMSMPITYDFKVDRPFYYAIVKRIGGPQGSGIVLFQGHYTAEN